MEWLSLIADVVGIAGAVFALFAWIKARQIQQTLEQEKQRRNQKVSIVLKYKEDKYQLPVKIQRSEITRAEILGLLGMIPIKQPIAEKQIRFSLPYLSKPDFQIGMNEVIEGDGDAVLTIDCEKEEVLNQFDLASLVKL